MQLTIYLSIILIGITALINWLAAFRHHHRLYFITKPLVMIFGIIIFILLGAAKGVGIWFLLALILSLIGDVALMFPEKGFIPGLLAFLSAHIAYIIGFNQTEPPLLALIIALVLLIPLDLLISRFFIKAIKRKSQPLIITRLVPVYIVIISLMLLSTFLLLFKPEWTQKAALLCVLGGILFFASDSTLAYNKFVTPFKLADLAVISTYHLAQLFLILGFLVFGGII